MTGWFRTGRVMDGEPRDRVEAWLRRRFPQYPHVVRDLYRDTCAALMSWLVLVVVGVAAVLGLQLGVTFVDALRHAGLVIVGLVAAWWLVVGGADVMAALLWYLLFRLDEHKAKRNRKKHPQGPADHFDSKWGRALVIVVNRHFLHAWALLASAVLLLLVLDRPWQVVLALTSLALLGPTLASWGGLALARYYRIDRKDIAYADVSWLRRPVYYAATVTSVTLLLFLKGAAGYSALVWFSLLVLVAVAIRSATFKRWFLTYRAQDKDRATANKRRRFRAELARTAKVQDVVVVGLVLLSPGVLLLLPVFDEQEVARTSTLARVAEWVDRRSCEAPLAGEPDGVQVFLVADNQFRAVNGRPSMGHSPVIDRVVPVAVRPIELDLLSGATLDHFARTYRAAKELWPNLKWAHLGDFADLGCRSELERLRGVVGAFGSGFLGMAPGNHDSYFTGNFAWHPDWTENGACPGGGPQQRLGENGTNAFIEGLLLEHKQGKDGRPPLATGEVAQTNWEEHDFFGRVVSLGNLEVGGRERAVVAAFLDTSDYSDLGWVGAAGVTGAISDEQKDWMLSKLRASDALVVFFQHHPFEALSRGSKTRYSEMVNQLGRRVVAIVSAHTHTSQRRSPLVDMRRIPQFVVGSTTDPPQEAALLRLRSTEDGYEIDFRTIPAVTRKGLDCGPRLTGSSPTETPGSPGPVAIDANVCSTRMQQLESRCPDLFDPCECGGRLDACECDERNRCNHDRSKIAEACDGLQKRDFQSIDEQREDQERRARRLLHCFKSVHDAPVGDKPLESVENPDELLGLHCDDEKAECRDRRTDLVCLSWAASLLQGHKHAGWTLDLSAKLGHQPLATYAAWASTKKVVWTPSATAVASKP